MILAYALPKTGHPNCRQPDKVIDAGQLCHRNFDSWLNLYHPVRSDLSMNNPNLFEVSI